jgi:hypothetical protein
MRRVLTMPFVILVTLVLAPCASQLTAADLTKVDRTIIKEPTYEGKPKYCLLVFGAEAKARVWLALDGDTLYVDRDGEKYFPARTRSTPSSAYSWPVTSPPAGASTLASMSPTASPIPPSCRLRPTTSSRRNCSTSIPASPS